MAIISKKTDKKHFKKQKVSNWWFSLRTLPKMRKRIKKIYYAYLDEIGAEETSKLQIYPEDFKKYSNKKIERGLDLFVKRKELASWSKIQVQNADAYILVFPTQNRTQERFSKAKSKQLCRTPQEIDLNTVQIEPIKTPSDNVYTNTPTNTTNIEQEEPEDISEPEEDYSEPF